MEEVIDIHTVILISSNEQRFDGILNRSSLEAAVNAPRLSICDKDIYPDTVSKLTAR